MKKFFKKLNNRGASLVFTLLAILVVLILASLILSLSLSNFQSKAVDNMSRENFYSVEQAANEMYAGIGSYSMDILGSAYATALSSVSVADLNGTITQVPTDQLNIFFREEYMVNVIKYMTGVTYARNALFDKDAAGAPDYATKDPTVFTQADNEAMFNVALTRLQQCLTQSSGVTVSIDGDLTMDYAKFAFIIGDVHVEYEENGLLSKETFDMEIGFPDWSLTFLANKGSLGDDFANFALVGDRGVNFDADTTVTGGVFGGGSPKSRDITVPSLNGIRINHVSVTVKPNEDGTGPVVSSGDIVVSSTLVASGQFTLDGGRLWCQNIVIPTNGSPTEDKESLIKLGTGSKSYVKDDLEIYGDNAKVEIAGNYMGYSLVNYTANGNSVNGTQSSSSAIIVNGNKDTVDIKSGANVYLAGNAYINQSAGGETNYMTGESIAMKTNQQAYMVPVDWMKSYTPTGGSTRKLSNPVPTSVFNEAANVLGSNPTSFVNMALVPQAVKDLLVDGNLVDDEGHPVDGKQIVRKNDTAKNYFYFNFKSTADAADYIQNYRTLLGDKAADINANLTGDSGAGTTIVVNGTLTTVGAVAAANGSTVNFNAANPAADTTAAVNQTNYNNRFALASHVLMEVPETKEDGSPNIIYEKTAASVNGVKPVTGHFSQMPTANYIIESELTNQSGTDEEITVADADGNNYKVTVIYTTGDITVSGLDEAKTYLIVTLGNATVRGSFTGLLMAEGSITVESDVTIKAAPATIKKFLELNPKSAAGNEVNKVFDTYKSSEENTNDDINRLQYSDVLELSNWRKY